MSKKVNPVLIFFLIAAVLLWSVPAAAENLNSTVETAKSSLQKIIEVYENSDDISDWEAVVLAINGRSVPASYIGSIEERVRGKKGTFRVATEYARTILVCKAAGGNPANVGGYNLIEKLYNYENISYQGVNGPMWALIALNGEKIPSDAKWTKGKLLKEMLSFQNTDGGFPLSKGSGSDVDLTGMALIALSNYRGVEKADAAVEKAVGYLASAQLKSGGYASWGTENSESTAQVIIGLASCGINLEDSRFKKQGVTLGEALMKYRNSDGFFKHVMDGGVNDMATEQAAQALTAIIGFSENGGSIYNRISGTTYEDRDDEFLKPASDKSISGSSDAAGVVTVRAEGRDKTCLTETQVNIVPGQTTLSQAVLDVLEKTGTPYTSASPDSSGHLIESIAGEYDWQWLINGKGGMITPDRILEDGDSILLVYGYLWDPVLTQLSVQEETPVKNSALTAILTAGGRPVPGQKINFGSYSAVTDEDGRAEFIPDRTGSFILTSETDGSNIRPAAITVKVKSDAVLPVVIKLSPGSTNMDINGVTEEIGTAPYTSGDRIMVPIRLVAENLGAVVEWDSDEMTAVFIIDDREPFSITIGEKPEGFDLAPEISESSVMVPVRYVSEKLGASVEWDEAEQTVTITKER